MFAEARSSVWRPLAVVESCRGWRRIAVSAAHSAQPGACATEDEEDKGTDDDHGDDTDKDKNTLIIMNFKKNKWEIKAC